jgi:hypothetical protein
MAAVAPLPPVDRVAVTTVVDHYLVPQHSRGSRRWSGSGLRPPPWRDRRRLW